jgi:recombination protein RecR
VSQLAPPLEHLIHELTKLPSVGRKTAQRLAFHLLNGPAEDADALARAITELREKIRTCKDCFNLAEDELCPICSDPKRDRALLCVVEAPINLLSLEKTGSYRGLYHVLGGALSPLKDIGPDELRFTELTERVRDGGFREVILATNPNVEGEATAVYLARLLKPLRLPVTRLAQGLPAGGDLEFTDALTLQRALEGRREY